MDGPVPHTYILFFLLMAPICLALLRALDSYAFRSRSKAQEPPLWGLPHIAALLFWWLAAQVFSGAFVHALAPNLPVSEQNFLVLAVVLAITVALVRGYLRVSGQPLSTLGFASTSAVNFLVLPFFYFLSIILLQPLCIGWEALLELLGQELKEQLVLQEFRAAVADGERRPIVMFAVTAVVLAPATEEVVFRGVFFGGLTRRWGFWPAALASSLVFGAVHFSLSAFFPLFLVGMVLCYLYQRTGSIYPAMGYHALFNGMTLVAVLVPESAA